MRDSLRARYRVRAEAGSVERRAREIAVEQSVEMPVEAIADPQVLSEIVGEVLDIAEVAPGAFEVDIALSSATVGGDAGQLLNMLYGNTSLHDDVTLEDVQFGADMARAFQGPRQGPRGLRRRVRAHGRALTCSALKPQGLPPAGLADLARRFAQGGIDFIKDDHGLADQRYSPFPERVARIAEALSGADRTRYVPSLSGDLDRMRGQIEIARRAGVDAVMVAPMIAGLAGLHRLSTDNPDLAFFAHPAMGGAARIAPPLLIGKLFRLAGADAVIFPNHGGRFGYTPETCAAIAAAARDPALPLGPSMPVPAGGMTLDRVGEMLDFYGADSMLLIGGGLLSAGDRLAERTAEFVSAARNHAYARSRRTAYASELAQGAG